MGSDADRASVHHAPHSPRTGPTQDRARRAGLGAAARAALETVTGRNERPDPVLTRTGGPAGNAQLTAWIGLALLILILAELLTLLDVTGLIRWHIAVGVLLVSLSLAKIGSTGWRVVGYYRGAPAYRRAGPPPLLLRLLGPLVVLGTLAVLGSGLALIALGPRLGAVAMLSVAGRPISPLTIHQATFAGWGVLTGLHVLARGLPALALSGRRRGEGQLHGRSARALVLLGALIAGGVAAAIALRLSASWESAPGDQ